MPADEDSIYEIAIRGVGLDPTARYKAYGETNRRYVINDSEGSREDGVEVIDRKTGDVRFYITKHLRPETVKDLFRVVPGGRTQYVYWSECPECTAEDIVTQRQTERDLKRLRKGAGA